MLTYAINTVVLSSIYLLFSLGLSLAWGTARILNFAHGAIFTFSAFVVCIVSEHVSLSPWLVVVVGGAIGGALTLCVQMSAYEVILRRASSRNSAELQILVSGVALAGLALAVVDHVTNTLPFGLPVGIFHAHSYALGSGRISNIQISIVVCSSLVWISAFLWLRSSRHGLALRAVGQDPEAARIAGVNVDRIYRLTMLASGVLAGVGSALLVMYLGEMTPDTGSSLIIKGFSIVILGGIGSTVGVLVGSYILGATETAVLTYTSGLWVDAISFAIIVIVLVLRPYGLFGPKEAVRV